MRSYRSFLATTPHPRTPLGLRYPAEHGDGDHGAEVASGLEQESAGSWGATATLSDTITDITDWDANQK